MMRQRLKHLASRLMIPVVNWYLRRERSYRYNNIRVMVSPGVFHPGLFSSTKFILSYLANEDLSGRSVLELGCGSGLVAVAAAKMNAHVTATDINPLALKNTARNAELNNVALNLFLSDLFEKIPSQTFDWIIVNPPYYPRAPKTDAERAWFCGENFEYFHKFFSTLRPRLHPETKVIMVLTKGCDLTAIFSIAHAEGFSFELLREKDVLFDEKDFLYRIVPH